MVRLRNKTSLRNEIKSRKDSTGWLDNIWVDSEGNWSIHGTGITCPEEKKYRFDIFAGLYGETLDSSITRVFREIDFDLNKN